MDLQKYGKGELSGEELDSVTEKLVIAQIDSEYKKRWAKILKEKHNLDRLPPDPLKKTAHPKPIGLWKLAAAVILLLLLAFPAYQHWNNGSLERKVDQLIAADVFVNKEGGSKGAVLNASAIRENAIHAFNQQEYQTANEWYAQLFENQAQNISDHFYSGLCHLHLKKPQSAIDQFAFARDLMDDRRLFHQEINWYLSLALIKAGKKEAGKKELQQIQRSELYYDQAQELLEKM